MDMNNINSRPVAARLQETKSIADARFELLRVPEGRIPQMKITLLDEEGNQIRKGYLTPFRGYRFQVSGNAEGVGDYGSTYVMDLRALMQCLAKPYQASDVLEMMANQAIYEHIKNTLNIGEGKINAKCIDFYSIANSDTMGKFVEECMKWLLKADDLAKHGYVCNHIWSEENVAYCDE